MNTYPEMNEKIVGLLRMSDEPMNLYAAQRIEELDKELDLVHGCLTELYKIDAAIPVIKECLDKISKL